MRAVVLSQNFNETGNFVDGRVRRHETSIIGVPLLSPFFSFFLFVYFRAAPKTYVGSQARGRIGAEATGLRHGHSNMGSEPHLRPASQPTVMPDP